MSTMEDNVDTMAKHYVDTINGQPNAWGAYVSPIYGVSHNILPRMNSLFGTHVTQLAIKKAFNK
jgi:hypothetical protein